jgi:hypothetical protein
VRLKTLIIIAIFLVLFSLAVEPPWRASKSLTELLSELPQSSPESEELGDDCIPCRAIKAMGPQVIPKLERLLLVRDSTVRNRLLEVFRKTGFKMKWMEKRNNWWTAPLALSLIQPEGVIRGTRLTLYVSKVFKYSKTFLYAGLRSYVSAAISALTPMRVIWGGPGRFSGSCDPKALKIFAGPCPLSVSSVPALAGHELLKMARAEYEIPDPAARQLTLW